MAKTYIGLFKNSSGQWEKIVLNGEDEKNRFLDEFKEASAFIKRFCLDRGGHKDFFDCYEDAEAARKESEEVFVVAPPAHFSDQSADTEMFYEDP